DYTNPYLPVNPTAFEGLAQPVVGADGVKKDQESNVLLAAIENMQYAVTVDVLHTVFSAFGTVQKIAIFEKNGQTQALVQYPDVNTASVAKESLEGHCIYDGGYCKLHLTYSRHTDLNVKAHSDKSRDYTIPDTGMIAAQQPSNYPGAPAAPWMNPQTGAGYPSNGYGSGYVAGVTMPPQSHAAPAPSWDPSMQPGRQTFVSVPSTFPGQTSPIPPAYASAPISPSPGGSMPMAPSAGSRPYYP
ncbi:Polypyrimidine tract-binding protein-like protein 1, partial [Bienertia sinuspersici]